MAKFETGLFMCRVNRPVKLHKSVYDVSDCGSIIAKGNMFQSSKQYITSQSKMYYIDNGPAEGLWCPAQAVQIMPIERETPDSLPGTAPPDSTSLIGKYAKIKGDRPIVYKTFDGDVKIPNCLRVGDTLEIDYARTTVFNGELQFRYHILSNSTEDDTLNNAWLLQNGSVQVNQESGVEDGGELVEMIRPFAEEIYAPMPMAADTPNLDHSYYIPGENMPDINEEPWNLRDHIPDSWKSVIPENWRDYMPDNWQIPERWKTELPKDWLNDLPVEWLDNIPASWRELKWPEFPEDWNNILPNNYREIFPGLGEFFDNFKGEIPKNWYDMLPEDLKAKIPEEIKNFKIPDKEVIKDKWNKSPVSQITNSVLNYASSFGYSLLQYVDKLITPLKPDNSEAAEMYMDNVDPTEWDRIRAAFQGNYAAYNSSTSTGLMGNSIGRLLFAHGMPFQFTGITDRRNGSTAGGAVMDSTESIEGKQSGSVDVYGRSFAKEIAANIPICTIVPGKPKFLTNLRDSLFGGNMPNLFGGGKRKATANALVTALAGGEDAFETFTNEFTSSDLSGDYEYYSMEIDVSTYFEYVNSLCHTSARMMGIGGQTYMNSALGSFDWGKYNSSDMQDNDIFLQVVGLDAGVAFTFDPQAGGVSDTISTSTTESSLASKLNGYSAQARELEFLLGYSGVDVGNLIDSTNFTESTFGSETSTSGDVGIVKAMKRIGSWLSNSVHGMNIKFPEIWSDSQHTRSYSIEMHFVAPYGTTFCKWRYVLVPFFHAFALAAPRSDANVSQYRSPFLIRAFSKGYFNVEMGMIESLDWKRYGDGSMISEDGVPLQIDVTLQFKDLYHVLTMTNMYREDGNTGLGASNNVGNFFNNTGLIDMIGTLSGVDVNRVSMGDRMELMIASTMDTIGSAPQNYLRRFSEHFRNFFGSFYGF